MNLAAMASVSVATVLAPIWAPLMGVASVGALLWAALKTSDDTKAADLLKSQANLKTTVGNIINQVKGQLTEISIVNEQYKSQYQGFISVLRTNAQEAIVNTYEKHLKELDALKKTIDEAPQDKDLVPALRYMLSMWEKNMIKLKEIHTLLKSMDKN